MWCVGDRRCLRQVKRVAQRWMRIKPGGMFSWRRFNICFDCEGESTGDNSKIGLGFLLIVAYEKWLILTTRQSKIERESFL